MPISSRKLSARIFTVGCSSTKALIVPEEIGELDNPGQGEKQKNAHDHRQAEADRPRPLP
jgi:hypothetical protein